MKQPRTAVLRQFLLLAFCASAVWWPLTSAQAASTPGLPLAQADEPANPEAAEPDATEPDTAAPEDSQQDGTGIEHAPDVNADPDYVPPPIERDVDKLPFPVRRMRELLIEAAKSGDIERLRPYIGSGDDMTMLSFGGVEGDPIEFLKAASGDKEGDEILAILLEVLEAGYVHVDPGTENEMYIWPYFYAQPLDRLTPPQRVELFTLLTYGDYQEMVSFGAYIFYRVGITPKGRLQFFVAGD